MGFGGLSSNSREIYSIVMSIRFKTPEWGRLKVGMLQQNGYQVLQLKEKNSIIFNFWQNIQIWIVIFVTKSIEIA